MKKLALYTVIASIILGSSASFANTQDEIGDQEGYVCTYYLTDNAGKAIELRWDEKIQGIQSRVVKVQVPVEHVLSERVNNIRECYNAVGWILKQGQCARFWINNIFSSSDGVCVR